MCKLDGWLNWPNCRNLRNICEKGLKAWPIPKYRKGTQSKVEKSSRCISLRHVDAQITPTSSAVRFQTRKKSIQIQGASKPSTCCWSYSHRSWPGKKAARSPLSVQGAMVGNKGLWHSNPASWRGKKTKWSTPILAMHGLCGCHWDLNPIWSWGQDANECHSRTCDKFPHLHISRLPRLAWLWFWRWSLSS